MCAYVPPSGAQCYPCPLAGECPGGAVIFPREGAWHSAANSDYFIPCQNAGACRDGDAEAQVGAVHGAGVEWCNGRSLLP